MKYRREIDGLRAVAVLPVILFHAGISSFSGGFVGVDVFFVISGYLITTIILSERENGTFSLVNFYERRARRILPALFLVMFCCLPFVWMWLLPNHVKEFSKSMISVSLFSSNFFFWQQSGYFDTAAELKPLLHTWSLAVEEQYYFLFPLFLSLLWGLRKRWICWSILILAIASLIFAQWGSHNLPSATFFLLPARIWELAIGALIAFYLFYRKNEESILSKRLVCEVFGVLGLALIFYSVVVFDASTPFPSVYALLPTVGTGLIILFASLRTAVGRFLGARPLVGIGLISYSAYLWHQPLFVFARHRSIGEPGIVILSVLAVASLMLAYLSWRWVEVPFRNREVFGTRRVFKLAALGSILFISFGTVGYATKGLDFRTNSAGVSLRKISEKVAANKGLSSKCDHTFTLSPECRTSDEPEILVWGDSYAMHLAEGVMASHPGAKMIQMTKSGCGPFFDIAPLDKDDTLRWANGCLDFSNSVQEWLKENKTVKYVVLSSPFSQYLEGNQLLIDGKLYPANRSIALQYFLRTLDRIKELGLKPIVFSPPPRNGQNLGQCLVSASFFGENLDQCSFRAIDLSDEAKRADDFLREVSKRNDVLFLKDAICQEGVCNPSSGSVFLYSDGGHLSREGAALLGRKLDFYGAISGSGQPEARAKLSLARR